MRKQETVVGLSVLALSAVLFAISGEPSHAAPGDEVTYQGRLTDSNGKPLEGAVTRLTFRLYSASTPTPGTFLWGEVHEAVDVRRGVFTVSLGEGDLTGCYAPRRRMCAGLTGVDPEQVVLLRG